MLCWCRHFLRSTELGTLKADDTGRFVKECEIENLMNHRDMVIPGCSARLQADIEQALPNWKITVGPEDANMIGCFLLGLTKN